MQQEKAIQRENFFGSIFQVKWLSCRRVPYSQAKMAPDKGTSAMAGMGEHEP
jgi:hypothetical protein